MKPDATSFLGRFATRHALSITFIAVALCLAGVLSALRMPSSVFPQTNFPRVVILVDNGIMPADEMMATVTRPIEEAMKDIPGRDHGAFGDQARFGPDQRFFQLARGHVAVGTVCAGAALANPRRSAGDRRNRGRARDVLGVSHHRHQPHQFQPRHHGCCGRRRIMQLKPLLPANSRRGEAWKSSAAAQPEYHVVVDPLKLQAAGLGLPDVSDALTKNNLVAPAGMMEENYHLYLTTVDGRAHSPEDIENVVIAVRGGHPVRIRDVARVERGPAPAFTDGHRAGPQGRVAQHPKPAGRQHTGHRRGVAGEVAAAPAGIAAGHAPRHFSTTSRSSCAIRWAASGTRLSSG